MASKTCANETVAVPLSAFVADIEQRRIAAGNSELPRNSGRNRTASKRALLAAIEDVGGKW